MWIFNWAFLMFLVLIMPFGLGMIPVKYMSETQRTPAMLYACGWFVNFALFELVSIPFILLQRSFTELAIVYTVCILLVFVWSIWKGHRVLVECKRHILAFKTMTPLVRIGWCIALLCIAAQVVMALFFEYWDGDDAYYMAQAMIADTYDVMYLRDAYTGYEFGFDIRHALSPVPIYFAWLSKLTGIHAVIIAHSVIAPTWLILMYCIYGLLAERLLGQHRNDKPLFMILISLWFCFGNVSIYTAESFVMNRIWQGKGLMAAIVLPSLLLCLFYLAEKEVSRGIWILFVACIIASGFATTTALMIVPTLVGLAAILLTFQKKSIVWMAKLLLCCLPCVVLGVLYLFLR